MRHAVAKMLIKKTDHRPATHLLPSVSGRYSPTIQLEADMSHEEAREGIMIFFKLHGMGQASVQVCPREPLAVTPQL